MKRLIFLWIAVTTATLLSAQNQTFTLTGNVLTREKQPVEFMNVILLKNDSTPHAYTLTDSLGAFSFTAEEGTYILRLQQFSREFYRKAFVLRKDTAFGELQVAESSLGSVAIEGRRNLIERRADRLIFNVENSAAATGGTALDALKATPLVRVQNETVSLVGKSEVLVMVDDRLLRLSPEELANLLKSIPADNIKSIEVITTPPAKYDAEGNGGLINIKLKTAKANSWNANVGTTYTQRTYAGGNINGAFTYNHKRLSLQASVSAGSQDWLSTSDRRTFYPHENWYLNVTDKTSNKNLGLNVGVDYKILKNWTTGLRYLGSFTGDNSQNNPFTVRTDAHSGAVNSYISSAVSAGNQSGMHAVNWFNTFTLDSSGTTLSTDFDYFSHKNSDQRSFSGNELDPHSHLLPSTYFASTNANLNRIENYSGKADVEMPLKWASLSFGGKFSYTRTDNDLNVVDLKTGTPVYDNSQSNVFRYKEYNEALYVSASKKIGSKWQMQAGLRMEATQTEGYSQNLAQTNTNRYVKFFPTAYVTYSPNDSHSVSLSYSRRIRRPGFDYLNPFIVRSSPYYYSEGNPFLRPTIMDNLELSYIFRQNWVSSVYVWYASDFSQSIPVLDVQTNVTRTVPLNYANEYQIGFSTYYNFNKWFWWNSFTGFNVNYQNIRSKVDAVASVDGFNAYIYSNNDFAANKDKTILFSLNYGLQLPGRYQLFHLSTMHILDLGMKFLFLDKTLTLSLAAQDLLNGQRPLIAYQTNGVKADIKDYNDTRCFRISVSYRFGNQNLSAKQRNFGNEEERNRVE